MNALQEDMLEFRSQLEKGRIQKAYRALLAFMTNLKGHFAMKYPDYAVSGSLYHGYMDMTYFSILPASLRDRGLKIAVVFLYDDFRFEIWLSGKNKQVLRTYWEIFGTTNWNRYKIVEPVKGVDFIVEHTLVENPNFSDLESLTAEIDQSALQFIQGIEDFLKEND